MKGFIVINNSIMKINPKTKIAYIDSNVREHEILMYGNGVIQGQD